MHIIITSRCNMHCGHCGGAYTEKGADMTIETFRNALNVSSGYISIGGGEPTIHPGFISMLFEAIGTADGVWVATNGSQTQIALTLAKLAKKGVISTALSIDKWHDEIDPRVIKAFERKEKIRGYDSEADVDMREIRNVSDRVIRSGRADWGRETCFCPDLTVCPDGTVTVCGCKEAPILGNVNTKVEYPDGFLYGECYKNQGVYGSQDIHN